MVYRIAISVHVQLCNLRDQGLLTARLSSNLSDDRHRAQAHARAFPICPAEWPELRRDLYSEN